MIPIKLNPGDEVRIISPSRSLSIVSKEVRELAKKRLEDMGLQISFSQNAEETDEFMSSSIHSRVADIHEAFLDPNVKAILTSIGGFSSNQILNYLDYELFKSHPKIICGYSDATALLNGIYARTDLVTYSGVHFSTFGMKTGLNYTVNYFKKCLFLTEKFEFLPSQEWSDDPWYKKQENQEFLKNKGYLVINEGEAFGTILGGNLCTFNLLHGTIFMPDLTDKILLIEDNNMLGSRTVNMFDRHLQSLIHQPNFEEVKGIIIGRFPRNAEMTDELLLKIVNSKKELNNIPVIARVDFGHTTPQFTFPIGGKIEISAYIDRGVKLKITEH